VEQVFYGIIGAGWRAEFYLRIAQEFPDRFQVGGMVVRDEDKGQLMEDVWQVKTYRTLDDLLEESRLHFVVVSVPWSVTPVMLRELTQCGMPALAETPPAPDLDGLIALCELTEREAKIQVAEQYQFQPLHAARIHLVHSGKLGSVTQAQISVAHGYHGMSLMRKFLGVGFENAAITAREFVSPIVSGPDRAGPPRVERITDSSQIIAHLDFGDKLGVYDFTGDQYLSWIRGLRVLVRGERGEISDGRVRYLKDFHTPIALELKRLDAGQNGNLEGYYHKGILAGDEWIYQNPFVLARLSDDEIAVATCLDNMARYVNGGPGFYSLAEASQDHYLGLMVDEAVETGKTVLTKRQPWALAVEDKST
jgi:predicted dehydrogenase